MLKAYFHQWFMNKDRNKNLKTTGYKMLEFVEKELSDYLDDLLVQDHIEAPRQSHIEGGGFGMGMLIVVKEKPRVNFKIEIYPNETEEPHFKITYQNQTCRFKISDCSPMKAEGKAGIPTQINKIMKQIKKTWADNKKDIIKAWNNSRPQDRNLGHQKIR